MIDRSVEANCVSSPRQTIAEDQTSKTEREGKSRYLAYGAMLLVVLLFAGIRWRLRETPLERDEGEYAYSGQLILQGIPPYQLEYNMKLPGTYVAYAAILGVFGETISGIHMGLLLVNACTTILVYCVGRKLHGELVGAVAGASYGLLSTSEAVLGLAAHATHFVVLAGVVGLLFLLRSEETRKLSGYFAAGLCAGLAFLMKQPGIVYVLFGAQQIALGGWKEGKRTFGMRLGAFGAGAALPYAATCAVLYRARVLARFWFWTVSYARQYGTMTNISQGLRNLTEIVPQIVWAAPVVWCFVGIGIVATLAERKKNPHGDFLNTLLIWSFLGVSAGLYYRDHYFILMLPAVCLLTGKAVQWCAQQRAGNMQLAVLAIAVFAAGCGQSLYAQRKVLFEMDPESLCRFEYFGNPFPEAIVIGKYIREHSAPGARIAVLGSEPQIYFYAGRRSATGYILTYALMEEQKYATTMQQQMIAEIEKGQPEYLVKVMIPGSWMANAHSDTTIFRWADKYTSEQYQIVGIAEMGQTTTYVWDHAAEVYQPRSRYGVFLYKRKS